MVFIIYLVISLNIKVVKYIMSTMYKYLVIAMGVKKSLKLV